MLTRIAAAVVVLAAVAFLLVAGYAEAQPKTTPPSLKVTCYGYEGTTTRAYNCIPAEDQQHHMRTFVPPVGSTCNGGEILEYPPGRIIFQIRCQKGEGSHAAAAARQRGLRDREHPSVRIGYRSG